jgi:S1-C subfamily serine protease
MSKNKVKRMHFIYGGILVCILILFGSIEYVQYQQYQDTLSTLAQLNSKIADNKASLETSQKKVGVLEQKASVAEKDISSLSTSLDEKETAIKSLTGQLADVRVESKEQITKLEDQVSNLKIQNEDFSSVIESSIPAVVSIVTNVGSGSGFMVTSNGYIVTNNHVISKATAATVITSDGIRHSVYLVGGNSAADIAVLKIDGEHPYLRFADSDKIVVGEKVIAVGNPGGLDFTVTQGIVSAIKRLDKGYSFVQIDVAINPGNSGGPLINTAGKVVGVNTKKIAGFEGVGFALESNQAKDAAFDLINIYEKEQG